MRHYQNSVLRFEKSFDRYFCLAGSFVSFFKLFFEFGNFSFLENQEYDNAGKYSDENTDHHVKVITFPKKIGGFFIRSLLCEA
jgi:hypothetical protein